MDFRTSLGVIVIGACIFVNGCQRFHAPAEHPNRIKPAIIADCIAEYFKADETGYITQQTHRFNPSQHYFAMIAEEPTGLVEYTLEQNQFSVSVPQSKTLSDLPRSYCTAILANGIFYSFCAGGDLIVPETFNPADNVKLEGRWYQAIHLNGTETILYKALDTGRIELVLVRDDNEQWLLRSYNLRYSMQLERKLPRSIDVFDVRDGLASKSLVARFKYQDVQNYAAMNTQ